mmetsp:Transcript_25419/g.62954  ORF Transcript_25419/g.62954 Transcript_25419/m.62954 type:complete len:582 (-) Transcript_25419:353-2098(-)
MSTWRFRTFRRLWLTLSLLLCVLSLFVFIGFLRRGADMTGSAPRNLLPVRREQMSWTNLSPATLRGLESRLEVPFYIYDTPSVSELYNLCQSAARSILEGEWPPYLPKGMGDVNKKNYDEVYWLDQLANDSWRVADPDKALVFVIPVYPVLSLERACEGRSRKKTHKLAAEAVKEIVGMPYFRRNGGLDHIVMGIDWRFRYAGGIRDALGYEFATLAKNITWGRKLAERDLGHIGCAVTAPFTSSLTFLQKAYQPFEKETLLERQLIEPEDVFEDDKLSTSLNPPSKYDWFARDYLMFFQGQASLRRGYLYRRLGFKHLTGWDFVAEFCAEGECPRSSNVFVSSSTTHKHLLFLDVSGKEVKQALPDCPRKHEEREVSGVSLGKFERCRGLKRARSINEKNLALLRAATFLHRLANSKLNLCFRGDDVTSSRYVDGIRTRTLNVLITEAKDMFKYAIPFQCEIPWQKFTYVVDGSEYKQDPRKALVPILKEIYTDHAAVKEKLRLMDYYSRKILWDAPNSTTARSVLRAMTRQCLTTEIKADFLRRTSQITDIHSHPLFAKCPFSDRSARRENQTNTRLEG